MTALQLSTSPSVSSPAGNGIFSRVVLAIDFGPASLGAARWATTQVAQNAEAVLMHVMPHEDRQRENDSTSTAFGVSRLQLTPAIAGGLGGFAGTLEVASFRTLVRVGRPSACLAAVANDVEASLLVLGRRADANRIRVGEPNVIERSARRTSVSVLVVPEGTTDAPGHVVAAVDESPFASQVLRVACRIARMHEARLTVLHVLSPVAGAYERVIRSAKQLLSDVRRRALEVPGRPMAPPSPPPSAMRWLVHLSRAHHLVGYDATRITMGDPSREIVKTATDRGASMVVVGLRGADESPPGSLGSVARELLTRAPIPVLAVNVI